MERLLALRSGGLVSEVRRSVRSLVVTLVGVLVLGMAATTYLLLVTQPDIERHTELTRQSRILQVAMLDQETGLHGWLATGDDAFLEPYERGREAAQASSTRLIRMSTLDHHPEIVEHVVDLTLARGAWEAWAADVVATHDPGTPGSAARTAEVLAAGKVLFDAYRTADASTSGPIIALRDAALGRQSGTLLVLVLSYVGALAVAGAGALRLNRRLTRTVLEPVDHVLGTIDALRAGDMTARTRTTGLRELDSVGAALGDLADDLAAAQHLAVARDRRLTLLAARLETVVRVTREVSGSLSVRYVSESVAAAAADLLGTPTTLWVRGDDALLHAVRHSDDPHGRTPSVDLDVPTAVNTSADEARPAADGSTRAYPLVLAGMVVGVLQVDAGAGTGTGAGTAPDPDTGRVLEALLSTAAAALESARLHSAARELADVDALTQLPNRRRMEVDLQVEWDRSRRYGRPLSFVMIDLDHFKQLNDDHGHQVGDAVLHDVARAIAQTLRAGDTAYRYGGEEIALLLRETDLGGAALLGERIRTALAGVRAVQGTVTVTASLGAAERTSEMRFHAEMVSAADAALYTAKRTGRDRVVTHPLPLEQPAGQPLEPAL